MRFPNPHQQHPGVYPAQQPMAPQQYIPGHHHPMQPGQHPQAQIPQGYPQGQYPQQFPGGHPAQYMQPGQYPQSQMPMGYPQGQIPQGYPQGQFPQQYIPNQGQYPQQNNQASMSGGRYGQSANPQQTFSNEGASDRYQAQPQTPTQQTSDQQEVSVKPVLFTVKPTTHLLLNNQKVALKTITSEVQPNQVKQNEVQLITDGVDAMVETVINEAYNEEKTALITLQTVIVDKSFYKVSMIDLFKELLVDDIKKFYNTIKTKFPEISSKYEMAVLSYYMNIITDTTNDYLAVNAKASISIDDFYTDFNALLKVLRNTEEDMEDKLMDYLSDLIGATRNSLDLLAQEENVMHIPEICTVAYLDRHVLETGLENVGYEFVRVEDNAANVFLNTLVLNVVTRSRRDNFLLVTLDKSIFKCAISEDSKVHIRRFG